MADTTTETWDRHSWDAARKPLRSKPGDLHVTRRRGKPPVDPADIEFPITVRTFTPCPCGKAICRTHGSP